MVQQRIRPRRNRQSHGIREMLQETNLSPSNLVMPIFVIEEDGKEAIPSMPKVFRYGPNLLIGQLKLAWSMGIRSIELFPKIADSLKDSMASESYNKNGLIPNTIKRIKDTLPEMTIFSDVAMDPYSSDGHDGILKDGQILNDESLEILGKMALVQASAGATYIAPSDMMDGRVIYLRKLLDENGFSQVGILSYTAKYASSFYGPFRDALDSAPKKGDKKTYQMNFTNSREALRELFLDEQEGADIIMVKPALTYLDIIQKLRQQTNLPLAGYFVSGEYSMIMAAAQNGWLNEKEAMLEALTSIKRAGADLIFTYNTIELSQYLIK